MIKFTNCYDVTTDRRNFVKACVKLDECVRYSFDNDFNKACASFKRYLLDSNVTKECHTIKQVLNILNSRVDDTSTISWLLDDIELILIKWVDD